MENMFIRWEKRLFGIICIIALMFNCISLGGIGRLNRLIINVINDGGNGEDYSFYVKNISDGLTESIPYKDVLIEISGYFMHMVGVRGYYDDTYGISVTKDGYIVSGKDFTDTTYELQQMIMLKEHLDDKGIKLLYVNEPAKYIDDSVYRQEFGKESFLNRNMDVFLEELNENGIEYLDLRDNMTMEGLNSFDMFYKGDHHWTVPASRWAALKIVERLNQDYGYYIDPALFDESAFSYTEYRNCWLGEQARLLAESYIGLDDFTVVKPKYPTYFERLFNGNLEQGDFDIFIDYSTYEDKAGANGDVVSAKMNGWHYSYNSVGRITNYNAEYGNVLVLGDSYCRTLVPFLALGVRNIYEIEPRYMIEGQVLEEIDSGNYDTVIIAYAQFMLGSHDDEGNSNYRQFSFFD